MSWGVTSPAQASEWSADELIFRLCRGRGMTHHFFRPHPTFASGLTARTLGGRIMHSSAGDLQKR